MIEFNEIIFKNTNLMIKNKDFGYIIDGKFKKICNITVFIRAAAFIKRMTTHRNIKVVNTTKKYKKGGITYDNNYRI